MPGLSRRPSADRDISVLNDEQLSFVRAAPVAHLATADAEGRPHVVPVTFVFLDGAFWFAIDEKPKSTTRLKRIRNIEENANIALVIDRYDDDWSRLGWVMVQGTAEVVAEGGEAVLDALRAKYPQYREMSLEGRPVVRIKPSNVMGWGDLSPG